MKTKRIISFVLTLCMILSVTSAIMGVSLAATSQYKMGDVDNNGKIDSGDARLALRTSVKLEKYTKTDREFICADIDGNGTIESGEARLILRASVKLEDATKWTVPAYAAKDEPTTKKDEPTTKKDEPTTKKEEPTTKKEDPTSAPEPVVTKMEQPTCEKGETVETLKDGEHRYDTYTFTFKTIPKNLEELKQIKISDKETGGALMTCLAILVYEAYVPEEGELYGATSKNKTLEEVYEMLKYLCEYNPNSTASTTYHNKLGATDTKTTIHDQLFYKDKYKYTINSYKNGATVQNGYTPNLPVSITVIDKKDQFEKADGYPQKYRFWFQSAGADEDRHIDMFYSTKDSRWYVWGETWKYLLMGVKDPFIQWIRVNDPSIPKGRTMEQPTVTTGEKVLKDFTYEDKDGNKITETVHLKQYTFTFKTVPQTLGELMQFDISDPEMGAYLMPCLMILAYDNYVPQNGETMSDQPSTNTKLEEVYKMLQYLCDFDPDSNAATNYHNKLFPAATKQFIHEQLAYNNKYDYTINSYMNGATPQNDYTPDIPVSITVTEYVYDIGETTSNQPMKRIMIHCSGADSDRFLDTLYDAPNSRWFVYGNTWKFLLERVKDPIPEEW